MALVPFGGGGKKSTPKTTSSNAMPDRSRNEGSGFTFHPESTRATVRGTDYAGVRDGGRNGWKSTPATDMPESVE